MPSVEYSPPLSLIERAYRSLNRTTPPAILLPEHLSSESDPFQLISTVERAGQTGKLKLISVSARQLLEVALDTPKVVKDFDAMWFYELPKELVQYISEQRESRSVTQYNKCHSWRGLGTAAQANSWRGEVSKEADNGWLWEFGVVVVGEDDEVHLISISNPWYARKGAEKPWQTALSHDELSGFVGREDISATFRDMLSGVSGQPTISPVQQALDTDDQKMWWGEAMNTNTILSWGEWEKYKKLHKNTFAGRIMADVRKNTQNQLLYEAIKTAKLISGYSIEASPNVLPGSVSLQFIGDKKNWIHTRPPADQEKWEMESDRKEQESLLNSRSTWSYYDNNWLMNGISRIEFDRSKELNKSKEFLFSVELADVLSLGKASGESVGIRTVYIDRQIKSHDWRGVRTKKIVIGDADLGDGWRWDYRPREGNIQKLTREDWLLVANLFMEAKSRATTDSINRYKGVPGLTERTVVILANVKQLLIFKMTEAGIDQLTIDKIFKESGPEAALEA